MRRYQSPRAAFTLIEILVVLSIIALLATLSVAAVMRYQESARERNTNTHLSKIQLEFEKHWKAKVELIKKETVPPVIVELTKNADFSTDTARAKAFHLKMRLRQEFPQNFRELPSVTVSFAGLSTTYATKPFFTTSLKNPLQVPPGNFVELTPEAQSAALLVLIMSQGAGGGSTDVETISRTKLLDYPQANNNPNLQLRVFADEWGGPIAFRRLADDDMTDVRAELNQPPFVSLSPPGPVLKYDSQDPDGRLQLPQPPNPNTPPWPQYANARSYLAYPTPGMRPFIVDPFDGFNRGPFVFSAGKNGLFYLPNGFFETDLDNLYSFRLAQSGKGN